MCCLLKHRLRTMSRGVLYCCSGSNMIPRCHLVLRFWLDNSRLIDSLEKGSLAQSVRTALFERALYTLQQQDPHQYTRRNEPQRLTQRQPIIMLHVFMVHYRKSLYCPKEGMLSISVLPPHKRARTRAQVHQRIANEQHPACSR